MHPTEYAPFLLFKLVDGSGSNFFKYDGQCLTENVCNEQTTVTNVQKTVNSLCLVHENTCIETLTKASK
jgi:hypothetical protein